MTALAFLVLAALQGAAPAADCRISGRVVDAAGLPLPGVTVTMSEPGRTAAIETTVTTEQGGYCFRNAPGGPHQVRWTLTGFGIVEHRIDVPATGTVTRDVSMGPTFSESVVVTGTRTARHLDTVPVRTEVIGRAAIAAAGARTLADAVEYTTGLRVESNCQNCNFSQIRLLGLEGPYTQILVDSQPIISSLAQVYGIEQIPARMIERIEVIKGGGSALYGAGAVGGVINLIPREPTRTSGVFEARAENGGSVNGALDWVARDRRTLVTAFVQRDHVAPVDVDADGYTEVSRRDLQATGVRAVRYADDGRGKLTADFSDIREDRRGGNALDLAPHEADIAEAIDSVRQSFSAAWSHGFSPKLDYRLVFAVARTNRDSYYGTGRDPNAYGDTQNTLAVFDGQVDHYFSRRILSWGGQVTQDRTIDAQPAYGRAIDATYTSRGLFLQDHWTVADGWQLLSGLRLDWHSELARPVASPRVAVLYSPRESIDVRVSAARGFRAPQIFDEDLHLSSVGGDVRIITLDPGLREERATSLMAGVEWKPVAGIGQALVELNVFRTRLDHLFHAIEADDPATPDLEMLKTNLGGASVYGVEVNLGWGLGDTFVVQGGAVVGRARFDEPEPDFGSRDFFRSPQRYGNLSARWVLDSGWELFAGARFTGSMKAPHYAGYIDSNRLETTPAFATIDASVGRRFRFGARTLLVTASARNLTNAYQRDLDRGPLRDASYVYGPRFPRAFGLRAQVEF
jgi:outer membrane receptor for ferrienterochelin and colicins